MISGKGNESKMLSHDEIRSITAEALDRVSPAGKKILVIIPDATRTCPLPLLFDSIAGHLRGKAKKLDFLVALGTHPAMDDPAIDKLVGVNAADRNKRYGEVRIFNHLWDDPKALKNIGAISEEEVEKVTGGLFRMKVNVEINAMIFDYDHIIICGPVFPHEVVGFSGGYKYFFPGICGSEFLNFFHWLGAVISLPKIIGVKNTPVRDLINLAAGLVKIPVNALCMVVHHQELHGLYTGDPREAWSAAADLAALLEIKTVEKPFSRVLSCAPHMYDDLWTGGKCMYKMENVVADGGELVIYAPHITEVSYTHGKILDQVGYHVRDYFLKQWDKFKHYPWGILAHSTHVRGIGNYENGIEKPRVKVTLATSIPRDRCEKISLGYMDPKSIHPKEWENREKEGILYVPRAGEVLYKLKNPPSWASA